MAGTTSIPLTALSVGTHDFGPAAVADGDTLAVLTVDRTVSKGATPGFNGLTAATTCVITIWQSNDGGTTWDQLASDGFTGGLFVVRGVQVDSDDVGVSFWPGTGRLARAEVVIGGPSPVAVQGTLVTS